LPEFLELSGEVVLRLMFDAAFAAFAECAGAICGTVATAPDSFDIFPRVKFAIERPHLWKVISIWIWRQDCGLLDSLEIIYLGSFVAV
jgi:hypothetical protein